MPLPGSVNDRLVPHDKSGDTKKRFKFPSTKDKTMSSFPEEDLISDRKTEMEGTELKKGLAVDSYMTCAVRGCYASFKNLISKFNSLACVPTQERKYNALSNLFVLVIRSRDDLEEELHLCSDQNWLPRLLEITINQLRSIEERRATLGTVSSTCGYEFA
ncbi:unnamed protein product [Cochlearia groenlandica]